MCPSNNIPPSIIGTTDVPQVAPTVEVVMVVHSSIPEPQQAEMQRCYKTCINTFMERMCSGERNFKLFTTVAVADVSDAAPPAIKVTLLADPQVREGGASEHLEDFVIVTSDWVEMEVTPVPITSDTSIAIRCFNAGHSEVLPDCMTFMYGSDLAKMDRMDIILSSGEGVPRDGSVIVVASIGNKLCYSKFNVRRHTLI